MDLIHESATELLGRLSAGEITAAELTRGFLERIERYDGDLSAFIHVDGERALKRAEDIDRRRSSGDRLGALAGLPVAVKDLLCDHRQPTTCGSKMLEKFVPPYDATVVKRLFDEDAILIGRTNMDEFAMGSSTETAAMGPTRNPWDTERVPGGSSGGSAAAVAASMAPLAIGTDTGGSIRQPAAFCGVGGLKPTYGLVSRYGLVAFASSLDQVGTLARTAADAALGLGVIAGHDPRDSTSVARPRDDYAAALDRPIRGLRIGIAREHFAAGLDSQVEAAVREAIRELGSQGATVVELSLPHSRYVVATYYLIAPCEASSNLARYDGVHYGHRSDESAIRAELAAQRARLEAAGGSGEEVDSMLVGMYRKTRAEGFGLEVKRRIMLGTYALSAGYYDAYYLKALKVRRLIRSDYDRAFEDVDLIAGPTTPTPAYRIGEKSDDPLTMYLDDVYTASANLAGLPAISVPCGVTSEGLPIGLQLQGPPFSESRLLQTAAALERATDWHTQRPALS